MKKPGLKKRIESYLQQWKAYDPQKWLNGGELERLAMNNGYKASNASRRCRELYNEEVIERRENAKGHVEYRAL